MAQSPAPREVEPQELARYQAIWHGFTVYSKWGVIAICALLILMAFFLL